jgi:glycosyltransferase involved in cell wall biosynthesis
VFLFIGGGILMEELRAEAGARGLGNLMFRPYQPAERLGDSLAVPDVHIVVLRPELEGLIVPSKFYGIAAAGRPAIFIGSLAGEIAGLLSEADAGFAVATGDWAALKLSILRLLDDPSLRDRMGRNARRLCEERFSRLMALERWERVLAEVGSHRVAERPPQN